MIKLSLLFVICSLTYSCSDKPTVVYSKSFPLEKAGTIDTFVTYPTEHASDSIIGIEATPEISLADSISKLSAENLIIKCPKELKEYLIADLTYYKEAWKNVPNPILASYEGNDFGDYFHVMFKDENNNDYDFGFGDNNFGKYTLFDGEQYTDNPKYLNKKFKVYWEWKKAVFPCCSGGYEMVEAYFPTITDLEIIK